MIYVLYDKPEHLEDMSFLTRDLTSPFKAIYPDVRCTSIKFMYKYCLDCVKKSTDNDIIICWYDFMAVICWWICFFKRKKRNIVAINILLKYKPTMKNRIARMIYKKPLKSSNFYATITAKEYGDMLNDMLEIEKDYVLLHDVYHYNGNECWDEIPDYNKTVFCGGRNGRNWKLLFEIAKKMPDVIFDCVMPREYSEIYADEISENVNVYCDVSLDKFNDILYKSQIIVMPLDTQAPAGLTVLFEAAAYSKPVITSDTITTREYFSDKRGILCGDDVKDWIEAIRICLQNSDEVRRYTSNLKRYLETECSEYKYAATIKNIVNNILSH